MLCTKDSLFPIELFLSLELSSATLMSLNCLLKVGYKFSPLFHSSLFGMMFELCMLPIEFPTLF